MIPSSTCTSTVLGVSTGVRHVDRLRVYHAMVYCAMAARVVYTSDTVILVLKIRATYTIQFTGFH